MPSSARPSSPRAYGCSRSDACRPAWRRVREREREVGGRRQSLRVAHQAFREWLVETIPDQVADLREVIAEFEPDVIVTDASMWGPSLILHEARADPGGARVAADLRRDPRPRRAPARVGPCAGHRRARTRRRLGDHARHRARGPWAATTCRRAAGRLRPGTDGPRRQRAHRPAAALHGARASPSSISIVGTSRRACGTSAPASGIRPRLPRTASGSTACAPTAPGSTSPTAPRTSRTRSCCVRPSRGCRIASWRSSSRTAASADRRSSRPARRRRTSTYVAGSATRHCCRAVRRWSRPAGPARRWRGCAPGSRSCWFRRPGTSPTTRSGSRRPAPA